MEDPVQLMDAAAAAATRTGRFLREQFRAGLRATTKTYAHDVVTEADRHVESAIRGELLAAAPGSVVVGEEGGRAGDGSGSGVTWSIDPIDGTFNFVRGIPLFCTSVGLSIDGQPAGGCVYDPVHDELFTAAAGRLWHNGAPVPRGTPSQDPPLVLCDIPTAGISADPREDALLRDLLSVCADVRRIGSSALSLAWVAVGRADLAANADVFDWDVAAGRVLVAAAGGGYQDVPGPARYDRPGGFVAWSAGREELAGRVATALAALPALAPTR
ncbi:inositol monophosphatase family protein [Phytohabitans rumicis]|uniref:Histidinol-phosphatase n=1 Tax=Phytohabitans rumicis TaxID=1076125 RepID=A0A6V8KWJ0_9ACTN|nr:inositol monophosphatase [Phytohabitans rumicis]GFJ86761.1 inositol monophosphatase [Phytohabitans rumicis]